MSTPTERSALGVGNEENVIALIVENNPKPTAVPSGNFPSGLGAFGGGVERPRIRMALTSCILEGRCRRVDLGHAGHRASDSWGWAGREQMTN
jgi:hypothetical protein